MNIYIDYEINLRLKCWFYVTKFFFFGAVKLTKNAGFDKYKYLGYGTGFNSRGNFLLSDSSEFGKNVIIFIGADMSSSGHVDNGKKDILILGKGPTQGLDNTTLTADKENVINYKEEQKKFCF